MKTTMIEDFHVSIFGRRRHRKTKIHFLFFLFFYKAFTKKGNFFAGCFFFFFPFFSSALFFFRQNRRKLRFPNEIDSKNGKWKPKFAINLLYLFANFPKSYVSTGFSAKKTDDDEKKVKKKSPGVSTKFPFFVNALGT